MNDHDSLKNNTQRGFTLIELLVIIAIIALLMSILMPALSAVKAQAKTAICRSNLHQLVLANIGYATENDGCYVPAALDIFSANKHRWHGVREDSEELLDPLKGPLVEYLGDGAVKECPEKVRFIKGQDWDTNYEQGCGGYGYNQVYIGSRLWERYNNENCKVTTKDFEVASAAETLMFADTAMAKLDNGTAYYLEYSFAEPPFWLSNGKPATSWGYASPSIHFRHRKKANIGWADGHIDSRQMADFDGENGYGVRSADMMLGWFEPIDNTFFDLK